jgi:hypothetical protein
VERAKALLARSRPRITLGELHLEAMKVLVAALEKRKFAVTERPHPHADTSEAREGSEPLTQPPRQRGDAGARGETSKDGAPATEAPRQRGDASARGETSKGGAPATERPRQRGDAGAPGETSKGGAPATERPRQRRQRGDATEKGRVREGGEASTESPFPRARYIPAAVRREVYRRDGACCSYVDARGLRCTETRYLELHHLQPFAMNGAHEVANLALRCSAHNALAAEADFGKALVEERRRSSRHEALAQHQASRP